MTAALTPDEAGRLEALRGCNILDTDPESEFDDITLLASRICETPIAAISLLDDCRQWFKASVGLETVETPRDRSFCAYTISQPGVMVVPDTLSDERFASNPFVTGNLRIRFYAGAPLVMKDGHALGALCVLDQTPRKLTAWQTRALQALSRQVVGQMELRRTIIQLTRADESLREQMRMVALESEVREAFANGKTLPEMLRISCTSLVSHLGAAFARIWILDERDQMLELRASAGQYTHLDGPHARVPVGSLKIGLIAEERKPHLTNAVVGDPRVNDQEWAKKQGMVAFAGYPLLAGERLVGVLAVFARHALTGTVLTSLDAVASSIASGIDRRGSEAAICESEVRYHSLFENMLEGYAYCQTLFEGDSLRDFTYLEVNTAFEKLTGLNDVVGKKISELVPGVRESNRELFDIYGRVALTGKPEKCEVYLEALRIWFSVSVYSHDQEHFIAVFDNITERKVAEARLLEQAELLELAHDVIMVRDVDDTIRFWNRAGETVYGWTSNEVTGNRAAELLRTSPQAHALARKSLMETGDWSGELRQMRKDGKPVIVASRWTLLRDPQGNPKSILVINSDITEHKKLESQFLRTQRLESVGTLASGVAHDLNNVLSPILMAAPLLREEIALGLRQQLINNIEISAQRAADIVKQVLTFARGAEGDRLLVQPTHLIKEIARIAQDTFPKTIEVSVKYPQEPWAVEADPTQLHQVLLNLCVNARDAMPDGGEIVMSLENLMIDEHLATMMPGAKPGPYVVIKVSDSGTGIPPEVIDNIFDPFFTTKEIGKGTGLGLSTTLGIVKSHGGFINVYSEVGAGTTFKVFLPAAGDAQERMKACAEVLPPNGNGELLLVVDDERPIREMAEMILKRHGYRVALAADGTEALAIFARQFDEIKAVITDLIMPYMDGITLIRTLRKIKPEIAILASSGRGDEKRMKELSALNVPTCLIKPYSKIKLLTAVHDLLAGSAK
jgi:PAS domain S-box-containing protein